MKRKIRIFVILLTLPLLTSCFNYKDLEIGNVKSYHFNGFNNNKLDFSIIVPIDNPNKQNIIISDIDLKAYYKNIVLGKIESSEKIVIQKNTARDYEIPVTIKVTNVLAGFSLLTSPSNSIKQIKFEGNIQVKKGLYKTTLNIDKELSDKYLRF